MVDDIARRRRNRILLLLVFLIAGGLACWFYVLSPIHEFAHIITSNILGGGGKIINWTTARTWAEYGNQRIIQWSGAFGEMVVYLTLYGLVFIWKLRASGSFWLGAATAGLFRTHRLADFATHTDYWTGKVGDPKTAAALAVFHLVFGFFVFVAWFLFVGREIVFQTDILPFLRPERQRAPWLERIRRRWG